MLFDRAGIACRDDLCGAAPLTGRGSGLPAGQGARDFLWACAEMALQGLENGRADGETLEILVEREGGKAQREDFNTEKIGGKRHGAELPRLRSEVGFAMMCFADDAGISFFVGVCEVVSRAAPSRLLKASFACVVVRRASFVACRRGLAGLMATHCDVFLIMTG